MSVLDEIALAGIDRIERSLGAPAALRAVMSLEGTLGPGPSRARLLLRAMRYAAELDARELPALAASWSAEREHGATREALALVSQLAREHAAAARTIAQAEVTRSGDRRARYALARIYELEGAWDQALALLGPLGADARRVRVLFRAGRAPEAAALARTLLPLAGGAPYERLAVAVAALGASGRYVRVAALDVLAELATDRTHGPRAVAFALAHAEALGRDLTEIEADRIAALVKPYPQAAERLSSLGQGSSAGELEAPGHAARARAVIDGGSAGTRPSAPRSVSSWLALTAIAELGAGGRPRAALDELRGMLARGARAEVPHWTALRLLLARPALRDAGAALAEALFLARGDPPATGFVAIAVALERAGLPGMAERAWSRAAQRREPGASEHWAAVQRHAGWIAATRGERDRAIELLRGARARAKA